MNEESAAGKKGTVPSRERRRHAVGSDPRREDRQQRAALRKVARSERSTADQLDLLLARPGFAKRERARLTKEAPREEKKAS